MLTKLRWYHLYIALATIDLLVIATGLWLHHRTVRSFERLLRQTASVDAKVRDLTALGDSVMQLTAPAMDALTSHDVPAERERIRRMQVDLGAIKSRSHLPAKRLADFWAETGRLCAAEEAVFRAIEASPGHSPNAFLMDTVVDADRHRRKALRLLAGHQESLLSEAAEHHLEHATLLERQWLAEMVLGAGLLGALAGMIWYSKNLHQAHEALRTARSRVEEERRERLAMIGELCTGVAHGIQNPLAAIRSSAELLLDLGTMDPDSRGRVEDVFAETSRLSQRVRRLLSFARAAETDRCDVNVPAIIKEVLRELAPRFLDLGVRVELQLEEPGMDVEADQNEIASVLIELLSNALDHTPRGGLVTVTGYADAATVVLRIQDSGPGITQETAAHVFDLFFTTKQGGTGVGLAWARRIVTSLSGSLALDHPEGEGAAFRVILPRSTGTAGHASNAPLPAQDMLAGQFC